MKKSPPTPDVNAKAPRPRRLSSDADDVPTLDSPPANPRDLATGFDQGRMSSDQEHRAGQLPGSDESTLPEGTDSPADDRDAAQGVDPVRYAEYWSERQSLSRDDDPEFATLDDIHPGDVEPEDDLGEDMGTGDDAEEPGAVRRTPPRDRK